MAFEPQDQAGFLELWRRIFPDGYTDPIENEALGQGFDIPALQAKIFERVSEGIATTMQAYYLKPNSTQTRPHSSGGVRASGSVEVSRTAPADAEITLFQGTALIGIQPGTLGQDIEITTYVFTEDVVIPAGSLGPVTAAIEASVIGYQANVVEGTIENFVERGRAAILGTVDAPDLVRDTRGVAPGFLAGDKFNEGQIDQYIRLTGLPSGDTQPRRIIGVTAGTPTSTAQIDPPLAAGDVGSEPNIAVLEFADLGLTIEQAEPVGGGVSAVLDAIAKDRNQGRLPNETDEALRDRLCTLEDIISPGGIKRAITRILGPAGVNFTIKETRDIDTLKGFVFDLDPWDFGSIAAIPKVLGSELVGDGAVWMSESTLTRFFIVCVGPGNAGEFGGGYDSPMFPDNNAWDIIAWDGFPVIYNSQIGQVFQAADHGRAAGVGFVLVRDPALA